MEVNGRKNQYSEPKIAILDPDYPYVSLTKTDFINMVEPLLLEQGFTCKKDKDGSIEGLCSINRSCDSVLD